MSKLVIFGSAVVDLTFTVRTSLPKEGESIPGKFEASPGGKGLYQAVACARLSSKLSSTTFISSIGNDQFGAQVRDILTMEHIHECIANQDLGDRETSVTDVVCMLVTPGKTTSYIGCRNATDRLSADFVRSEAAAVIQAADVVLVTFDAAVEATKEVISLARAAGKPTVINASPPHEKMPLSVVQGADFVVATHKEAWEWLRLQGHLQADELESKAEESVARKIGALGAKTVILTSDDNGCIVVDSLGSRHYEAYTGGTPMGGTGARSASCAGLAVALVDPFEVEWALADSTPESNRIATASAARYFATQKAGNIQAMPYRVDLERFFERWPPLKLISPSAAQTITTDKGSAQPNKQPDLSVLGSKQPPKERTS